MDDPRKSYHAGNNIKVRHKDLRIERERRFLLARFPTGASSVRVRHIADRYIEGTTLRLRELRGEGEAPVFKLTQKIAMPGAGAQQGFITTMVLTEAEFRLLAELPGRTLRKMRHRVPPFGIDVFEGALEGLVLAEAEFESAEESSSLVVPSFILEEVSDDARFTGGRLVCATRDELLRLLADYGVFTSTSSQ
jgi:CYTH domain-containing protein